MTHTLVASATREHIIGFDKPFTIIGERINPTGRKLLAKEMAEGNFDRVRADAAEGDEQVWSLCMVEECEERGVTRECRDDAGERSEPAVDLADIMQKCCREHRPIGPRPERGFHPTGHTPRVPSRQRHRSLEVRHGTRSIAHAKQGEPQPTVHLAGARMPCRMRGQHRHGFRRVSRQEQCEAVVVDRVHRPRVEALHLRAKGAHCLQVAARRVCVQQRLAREHERRVARHELRPQGIGLCQIPFVERRVREE